MTSTQRMTAPATCHGTDIEGEFDAISLAPGPGRTSVCFAIAKYVTRMTPVRQPFAMFQGNRAQRARSACGRVAVDVLVSDLVHRRPIMRAEVPRPYREPAQ